MEFSTKASSAETLKTACLILPHFADAPFGAQAAAVDATSNGLLVDLVLRDLEEKAGSLLPIPALPGVTADRVLVVSLGKREEYTLKTLRTALASVGKWLAASKAERATLDTELLVPAGSELQAVLRTASQILADSAYRYNAPGAKKDDAPKGTTRIDFLLADKHDKEASTGITQGGAIAKGLKLARDLGNLPGNKCTPSHLAETAEELGKQYKFKVEVFDTAEIEKLGMGSFLSVTRGSAEPARFIVMQYKGGKGKQAPIVLVGKGLTFDSGGISLKPGEGMDEMKFDMCGAASVLGTFKAVAEMELPINLIGLIPSTENMPGGRAIKPGDVVTSLSGQTIEILNTDAEGRLILCDALTYAERFKPECVIDIATLTGACVIALGAHASGVLANDDALAGELVKIGQETGDRCWQLPIWEEYQEQLKSNFADMANIGGRPAGTITAACFLSRFTKAYKWAHLDIAGTAWKSGAEKGATGRPVTLLSQFLIQRAQAQ
ncbi:leucyl aminopeptidase [Uliginosibacterium gangwonense]|uniref:leucyl aminopeptidase n=1 Tax=Uliginosibacterium gangwonense TaxID=392736 RepID=UPI00037761F4|nr:leucyl aminopeptidase [Uliginosibacterium gangwonense]